MAQPVIDISARGTGVPPVCHAQKCAHHVYPTALTGRRSSGAVWCSTSFSLSKLRRQTEVCRTFYSKLHQYRPRL